MKLSYAKCQVYVNGIDDMDCPLCGQRVIAGVVHECSRPEKPAKKGK
jgi:hypothetical protein